MSNVFGSTMTAEEFDWQGLFLQRGNPLIPRWWSHKLGTETFYLLYGRQDTRAVNRLTSITIKDMVKGPFHIARTQEFLLPETLNAFGKLVEEKQKGFLQSPIGSPEIDFSSRLRLIDFPLLKSTYLRLYRANLLDGPLADFSDTPIADLLELNMSWMEIFDLAHLLSHGIKRQSIGSCSFKDLQITEYTLQIAREFIALDGDNLDETWATSFRDRYGLGVRAKTLEEIGSKHLVTRERVRQIFERIYSNQNWRPRIVWPLPTDITDWINQFSEMKSSLLNANDRLAINETPGNWTIADIQRLLEVSGNYLGSYVVSAVQYKIQKDSEVSKELRNQIRKYRSKLGFIDLNILLGINQTLTKESLIQAISSIYERVFVYEDWVLAGTSELTAAETAVGKQFAISPRIHIQELWDGINRVRANRNYPDLPPVSIVMSLLSLSGALKLEGDFATGIGIEQTGELKIWLLQTIKHSPGSVIHIHELSELCVNEGFKLSSVNAYLTYDPIIRKMDNGIVRLVGQSPKQEDIVNARLVATAQYVKEVFAYSIQPDNTIAINLTVGTRFCTNAVITPPRELRELILDESYSIRCCDLVEFDGKLKLSGSMWYGFQPVSQHLQLQHGVKKGNQIRIYLKNGYSQFSFEA